MYSIYYESATRGKHLITEAPTLQLASEVGTTYYEAYKKLREGYFIDNVVCVRIYSSKTNKVIQYGPI